MKTSQVSPERTMVFNNDLMRVMVELTDRGVAIDNIRDIITADLVHLNGMLMMYPNPAFYACLEERYRLNERLLQYIEQRLSELDDGGTDLRPPLN